MAEPTTYRNALPPGSMLYEYRLESVLGAGAFGMTYLARDSHLDKQVAIKEYLPTELAVRALDGSVVPVTTDHGYNYQWGLDRFMQEARTLARFSHPNIVRVYRCFEANGTGYMVMDYEQGVSLGAVAARGPTSRRGAPAGAAPAIARRAGRGSCGGLSASRHQARQRVRARRRRAGVARLWRGAASHRRGDEEPDLGSDARLRCRSSSIRAIPLRVRGRISTRSPVSPTGRFSVRTRPMP